MTEWRTIPSFPLYEASGDGQIRRVGSRVLAPATRAGYLSVTVSIANHKATVFVHRLVCEAFKGPPPSALHEVAHCDGDPKNNRPFNLRWATPKENQADRKLHGTATTSEAVHFAKLTAAQVREIRARKGEKSRLLAIEYGVTKENINSILRGATWKELL